MIDGSVEIYPTGIVFHLNHCQYDYVEYTFKPRKCIKMTCDKYHYWLVGNYQNTGNYWYGECTMFWVAKRIVKLLRKHWRRDSFGKARSKVAKKGS